MTTRVEGYGAVWYRDARKPLAVPSDVLLHDNRTYFSRPARCALHI
jgi:hypothetical protein